MPAKATAQKTMAGASVFDPTTAKCGLVDGGEADGVASSNEMIELMNNHALLMQSSTGGKSLLMYVPWASRARLSTGPPIALALLTETLRAIVFAGATTAMPTAPLTARRRRHQR